MNRKNESWFEKTLKQLDEQMPDIVEAGMLHVESEAKRIIYLGHPDHLDRQTGNAGRSITTESEKPEAGVVVATTGSNLSYFPIHELGGVVPNAFGRGGTAVIPPRPSLTPAFQSKKDIVRRKIVEQVKSVLRDKS